MFYYVEKFQMHANNAKLVTINDTIGGVEDLLHLFSVALRFPYPTVTNFNAFRDVMEELDWLQEEEIVVYHNSLPLLDEHEMACYIDVLNLIDVEWEKSAERAAIVKRYYENKGETIPADSWINQPPKKFNVYFRAEDKCFIETMIKLHSNDYRNCIHYDERGMEYPY
jgi:hypothetical protein